MAETVSFKAALGCIGLNANTQTAIINNGIQNIRDLLELQEEDLTSLPRHLCNWRITGANEAQQFLIPLMALRRLKAMRYWALSQQCLGVLPNAMAITPAVLTEMLARCAMMLTTPLRGKRLISRSPTPSRTWLSGHLFGTSLRLTSADSRVPPTRL
jgi:hypothetical protein